MGIELKTLSCNSCGASLPVQETTRFVTCTHCGSRLAIRRTGDAAFTEVIAALEAKTDQIAEDVEQLRRQDEVEALERQWRERRESYMEALPGGGAGRPFAATGVAVAVSGVVGSAILGVSLGITVDPGTGLLAAAIGSMVSLLVGAQIYYKASQYDEAEQDYLRRRAEALRRKDRRGRSEGVD